MVAEHLTELLLRCRERPTQWLVVLARSNSPFEPINCSHRRNELSRMLPFALATGGAVEQRRDGVGAKRTAGEKNDNERYGEQSRSISGSPIRLVVNYH